MSKLVAIAALAAFGASGDEKPVDKKQEKKATLLLVSSPAQLPKAQCILVLSSDGEFRDVDFHLIDKVKGLPVFIAAGKSKEETRCQVIMSIRDVNGTSIATLRAAMRDIKNAAPCDIEVFVLLR